MKNLVETLKRLAADIQQERSRMAVGRNRIGPGRRTLYTLHKRVRWGRDYRKRKLAMAGSTSQCPNPEYAKWATALAVRNSKRMT